MTRTLPCVRCGGPLGAWPVRMRTGDWCGNCAVVPWSGPESRSAETSRSAGAARGQSVRDAAIDEKIEAAVAAGVIERSSYWRYTDTA